MTRIAFTWSLFMIDLTLKGSIVLITAFLISKLCAKASFQFHHLIVFLGLCSFAVLPAIYQLDWFLFLHHSLGREFSNTQNIPAFTSGIAVTLLHNLMSLAPWLLMIWLAGFVRKIAGIIGGMLEMRHISRSSRKIEYVSWNKLLHTLLIEERLPSKIEIRETGQYPAPITCGFLKNLIILPREVRGWTEEQQQVVLLHELSHIRRRDNLLQLIAQFVAAVFWFNPLVRKAILKLRRNREGACDDYVLNAGFKPSVYAGHLLDIIHASRNNRASLAAYGKTPVIAKERLMNILDTSRIPRMLSPKAMILSILMGIIFILPFAAINPVAATERIPQISVSGQLGPSSSPVYRVHARSSLKTPVTRSSPHPAPAKSRTSKRNKTAIL